MQVKVSISPDLAKAFKTACESSNVSMAKTLSGYMAEYANAIEKAKAKPKVDGLATKRQRRGAIKRIIEQMEQIKKAQEQSRDRIPNNFQNSTVYEASDECVTLLEEAIELLETIY